MPTRRQCQRAIEIHQQELIALKGVIGLGIVCRREQESGGQDNAVAVYVDRQSAAAEDPKAESVPSFLTIDGPEQDPIRVPVEIVVQGPVSLERTDPSEPPSGKGPDPPADG